VSAKSRQFDAEFETETLFPRAWFRIDGDFSLGSKPKSGSEQHMAYAFNELTPGTEYEVFKLHKYRNGELAENPSKLVFRAKDDEDFTTWAYTVEEPGTTTDVNERLDDRRDHLPVRMTYTQGEDRAFAFGTTFDDEDKRELGEIQGLDGEILRGRDDEEWTLEQDTGAWTAKMDPSPIDWYRDAPRGIDLIEEAHYFSDEGDLKTDDELEKIAIYLDNFRDTVDLIVESYEHEHEAWEDFRERNYDSMAERIDGFSAQGLENMLEELPSQMDKMIDNIYDN